MSLIFADHTRMTVAASKLARAQAEFDAAAAKVNTIMLPLHAAVQDANDEFKQAVLACAKDEAAKISLYTDLNTMLYAAELNDTTGSTANGSGDQFATNGSGA